MSLNLIANVSMLILHVFSYATNQWVPKRVCSMRMEALPIFKNLANQLRVLL